MLALMAIKWSLCSINGIDKSRFTFWEKKITLLVKCCKVNEWTVLCFCTIKSLFDTKELLLEHNLHLSWWYCVVVCVVCCCSCARSFLLQLLGWEAIFISVMQFFCDMQVLCMQQWVCSNWWIIRVKSRNILLLHSKGKFGPLKRKPTYLVSYILIQFWIFHRSTQEYLRSKVSFSFESDHPPLSIVCGSWG